MNAATKPATATVAIVFDMDGVLADTERLKFRAHRAAVEAVGGGLDRDLYARQMGSAHIGVIRAFLAASDLDTSDDAVERYEERFQAAYRDLLATDLRPMPGARSLLAACRRQARPLALVTSSEGWMADIVLDAILEGIGEDGEGGEARSAFRTVVTADDVQNEKPDPEPYLTARRALEPENGLEDRKALQPENGARDDGRAIVAVEDTRAGVASASSAGLPVIAVRHDFNRHQDFDDAAAVIESLSPPDRFLARVDEIGLLS